VFTCAQEFSQVINEAVRLLPPNDPKCDVHLHTRHGIWNALKVACRRAKCVTVYHVSCEYVHRPMIVDIDDSAYHGPGQRIGAVCVHVNAIS
jgi:hypothetical protein